jgi:hypothetical protein
MRVFKNDDDAGSISNACHPYITFNLCVQNLLTMKFYVNILFLPRCPHTWERAPVSEHRADFTQFLNQDGR